MSRGNQGDKNVTPEKKNKWSFFKKSGKGRDSANSIKEGSIDSNDVGGDNFNQQMSPPKRSKATDKHQYSTPRS